MARLTDLANEVLFVIFNDLDQSSLVSLALVAKRFTHIAQENLFRDVSVLADIDHEGKIVLSLVNTLLHRPELAAKVRQISFHNPSHNGPVTSVSREEMSAALTFVSSIEEMDEDMLLECAEWNPEDTWYSGMADGEVRPYLGILLGLVPTLASLNIIKRVRWEEPFTLPALFGADEQGIHNESIPDIGHFPGLMSVQNLRIHGNDFTLATWYELPNLRKIELDCYQDYYGTEIDTAAHHEPDLDFLHTILLRCSSCFLLVPEKRDLGRSEDEWQCPRNPFEYIQDFTLPKRLEIEIVNVARVQLNDRDGNDSDGNDEQMQHVPIVNDPDYGSMVNFGAEMLSLGPQLEELESVSIRFRKDGIFSINVDHMGPLDDFTFLTGLKELTIAQQVILPAMNSPNNDLFPTFVDLLPTGIETMRILDPDVRIFAWFEQILDVRHLFPAFKTLCFEFERIAACEELRANCPVDASRCGQYRQAGLSITCCCHGRCYI
jgi:hypothetical protein